MPRMRTWLVLSLLIAAPAAPAAGQVQVRVGDPARTLYSELHEALRDHGF